MGPKYQDDNDHLPAVAKSQYVPEWGRMMMCGPASCPQGFTPDKRRTPPRRASTPQPRSYSRSNTLASVSSTTSSWPCPRGLLQLRPGGNGVIAALSSWNQLKPSLVEWLLTNMGHVLRKEEARQSGGPLVVPVIDWSARGLSGEQRMPDRQRSWNTAPGSRDQRQGDSPESTRLF